MVQRLRRHSNHEVVGYDIDRGALDEARRWGAHPAGSLTALVERLRPPRTAWLMLPPGEPTRSTIRALATLLSPGDLVVDGGNSKWTETLRLGRELDTRGIELVDVGTSGGVWGGDAGYCLMVGGSEHGVERLVPVLDALAAPPDGVHGRGWAHVGRPGAGHFVKMIHNGIEYALMEAYAEGFALLQASEFGLDNAQIAHLWMRGAVVRSWLCELAARAFDRRGNGLDELRGIIDDSGQGRWTLEEAATKGVPTPAIAASVYARFYSREGAEFAHRLLAALRAEFGGHRVYPSAHETEARLHTPAAL